MVAKLSRVLLVYRPRPAGVGVRAGLGLLEQSAHLAVRNLRQNVVG